MGGFDIFFNSNPALGDGTLAREDLPIFKEMAIDFETYEPLTANNEIVILEKNEALAVWVFRALKTELGKYEIHSNNYGNILFTNIGTIYTEGLKKLLITEEIKNCLLVNPYILSVENFIFNYNGDATTLKVEFQVTSIYGTFISGGDA